MKALVVDDSRAMRAILGRALSAVGYEIVEAADGIDALELLDQDGCPDLVVVDLHMPKMDGLEFVRNVRDDSRFDDMRILVASSDGDLSTIDTMLQVGADEYLMKPFDDEAIAEKLGLLGLRKSAP